MMKYLVRAARRFRRRFIPNDWVLLPIMRSMYTWTISHIPYFSRTGIPVNIGGLGYFKVHPSLAIGTYEFETWGSEHNSGFRQWVDACRGKQTVFDIGAHIGLYALPASRVLGLQGRLYAFEPADTNRYFLDKHLRYNNITTVEVIPDLVGDKIRDEVSFFEDTHVNGINSIDQETIARKDFLHQFRKTFKHQVNLDNFCQERNISPEVMKIDVEGGEWKVFQGAREILLQSKPLIFLSVHPTHLQHLGSSAEALYSLICEFGYEVYDTQGQTVTRLEKEEYVLKHENIKT